MRRFESAVPICENAVTIWVDEVSRKNLLASLAQFFSSVEVGSPAVLKAQADQHGATVVLIEDKASGTSLRQELRAEGFVIAQPAPSLDGDKIMRLHGQTAKIQNGFALFPSEAAWINVLNALQELTGARARLIQAQRDSVVASHTSLTAIGRFDHKRLALATPDYDPAVHYYQVRDAWHGLQTPSGQ